MLQRNFVHVNQLRSKHWHKYTFTNGSIKNMLYWLYRILQDLSSRLCLFHLLHAGRISNVCITLIGFVSGRIFFI